MKLIKPNVEILCIAEPVKIIKAIERIARKCYQSSHNITPDSYEDFVRKLIDNGHHSTLEHMSFTVTFTVDRGITQELVRHRLCAISQESTRYANYSKDRFGNEIALVQPFFFDPMEELKEIQVPVINTAYNPDKNNTETPYIGTFRPYMMNSFDVWYLTCQWSEWGYMTLINDFKRSPQEARTVLPNSLKSEIAITANLREWRHIFNMRAFGIAGTPHPQMREVMIPTLDKCHGLFPVIFDDIYDGTKEKGLFDIPNETVTSVLTDL